MTITWISREGLEAWTRDVLAKYPPADIELFIVRLRRVGQPERQVLPNVTPHRGIIQ